LALTNLLLLFSFLINLALGILVYKKNVKHKQINLTFSILSWACGAWALSVLLIYFSKQKHWMLFWGEMSFATSSLAAATFFYFSLLFPKGNPEKIRKVLLVLFPLYFLLILLIFSGLILLDVSHTPFGFQTNYGRVYPFFSIFIFGCILFGLYFLIMKYKKSAGIERLQIKYCFLGMFFSSIIGIFSNLILPLLGTSRLSGLGPSFTIIMVAFIAYSIVKHRLMDINIVFRKGTTYGLLMVLLFIPSFLLILLGQEIFLKEIKVPFAIFLFLILVLVAIFFYWIKPGAERTVEQLLFRRHYDYRETLGRFSKAMVSILDLKSLSEKTIETITETMGVEKASLFLSDEEKGGFRLFESKNLIAAPTLSFLPRANPLPVYLHRSGEIIIREELMKRVDVPELEGVTRQMSLLEAEVSIPLIWKGQLIGMINLSHKFNKEIYSHEDLELLSTLANQVAISMENAKLYEDLKRSKSYIRRADRLASLGTLTAGISHEIRNPLVAIKTFTQLLPERLKDEEFLNKFLNIASGEVDRISSLITELLDFAKPSEPKLELEDVNTILDSMILLLSTETGKKLIQLTKQYGIDLPPIRIDREQMKQAFLNILLNAIEATPENGKVTVRTRSFVKPGGQPYLQIEVSDTGCGIAAEYLEEIFNPFFTTKETGSGLGLSIAHQIVQEHKGYITVESQLDQGSSFYINLPLNQDHPQRRKSDNENHPNLINSF
jgi:two-component system NtrC family sensor kinase